jgi:hypothetical protein
LARILLTTALKAQTTFVFKDDSVLLSQIMETTNNYSVQYEILPYYFFKDHLQDGTYYVIDLFKSDSASKKLMDFVIAKGQYKNTQREGRFEYFTLLKKSPYRILTTLYTYHNGVLHGSFIAGNSVHLTHEGFYSNGKRDGFFITYKDASNSISTIEVFDNGHLKYKGVYNNENILTFEKNPILDTFQLRSGSNLIKRSHNFKNK